MACSKKEPYSFVVDLINPKFKKKFVTSDNTHWEVKGFWTFLSKENSSADDLWDDLAHVMIIKQKNNPDLAYEKTLEAYPLEQTEYSTIQRTLSYSLNWFSVTFREYFDAFRPKASGSFQKILCTLTITALDCLPDALEVEIPTRRSSVKKSYRYSSLQNISATAAKSITMKTVLQVLLQAMENEDEEKKTEAMDFIAKNFTELKTTELWQNFTKVHRDLTTDILNMLVEHMSNQTKRASKLLSEAVSKLDVREE